MLELFASFYRQPANPAELMDALGLAAKRETYFRRLSGGFRDEAERLCDRVMLIDHGQVTALDTPARPGTPASPRIHRVGQGRGQARAASSDGSGPRRARPGYRHDPALPAAVLRRDVDTQAEPVAAAPALGNYTPLGAAVQAMDQAMQGHFPPARPLLVMTAYAVIVGIAAIKLFRWE